jgi:hypothetical protein
MTAVVEQQQASAPPARWAARRLLPSPTRQFPLIHVNVCAAIAVAVQLRAFALHEEEVG